MVDLRHINTYFDPPAVKFEGLPNLKYAHADVRYGVKVDISDAYHHFKLHPDISKYFCFAVDSEIF